MNRNTHFFISIVFHPVFINLLSFFLLFQLFPSLHAIPAKAKLFIISFVFGCTAIIPMFSVLVLKWMGKINSIQLRDKDERRVPYFITAVGYLFCFYTLRYQAGPLISSYLLASAAILICVSLVNFFWKISAHMASMGAFCALFFVANLYTNTDTRLWITACFILSGLVATARLFSGSHNIWQILAGYLSGLVFMFYIL